MSLFPHRGIVPYNNPDDGFCRVVPCRQDSAQFLNPGKGTLGMEASSYSMELAKQLVVFGSSGSFPHRVHMGMGLSFIDPTL